mgnify:CR=1 FL=1
MIVALRIIQIIHCSTLKCINWENIVQAITTLKFFLISSLINIFQKGLNPKDLSYRFQNMKSSSNYHNMVIVASNCKKQINSLVNNFFPQIKLNCIFVNNCTIQSFFSLKDIIHSLVSFGVIYKYGCGQCQSTYMGEPQKHFFSELVNMKDYLFEQVDPLQHPLIAT